MDYLVSEKSGAAIQQAIERAAQAGGGRVVLEPGVYLSGTLYLRSNIELHIPAGAKILGESMPERYDDFRHPGFDAVAPEGSRKCLIAAAECENISITGGGEIDGNGPLFYDRNVPPGKFFVKPPHPRPRMVQLYRCRNVLIDGVSFLDSPGWSFWLIACEDVHISRIRIIGCQQMINNDGIDIDSCRRVTVSDSFFRTGDDCLILRAIRRSPAEPSICEEVTVTNCVLDSACQGIRIGCPSDDTIRHCSFSNIVFRGKGNGIVSVHPYRYLRKECCGYLQVSDLLFENFDIVSEGAPVVILCEGAIRLRGLERLTFRNFRVRARRPFQLEGNAVTPLADLRFSGISGTIGGDVPFIARHVSRLNLNEIELSGNTGELPLFERPESDSWESKF